MVGKITSNKKASCSLLPAIMGHSKYDSKNNVLKKVIDANAGIEDHWRGNEATGWGNTLEPVIIDTAAERLGIRHGGQVDKAAKHAEIPLEATLDAEGHGDGSVVSTNPDAGIYVMTPTDAITLDGVGVLEAKVTSHDIEDVPPISRGPLQAQGQMMCIGGKWGAVCVLYRGICLRTFLFERHPPTVDAITKAVIDFDRRVHSDPTDWYDIDDSDDAVIVYAEVKETETPIALNDEAALLLAEYVQLKESLAEGKTAMDLITVEVQKMLGNHAVGTAGTFECHWPMRRFKAQAEKVIPAKDARVVRQKTIMVRNLT